MKQGVGQPEAPGGRVELRWQEDALDRGKNGFGYHGPEFSRGQGLSVMKIRQIAELEANRRHPGAAQQWPALRVATAVGQIGPRDDLALDEVGEPLTDGGGDGIGGTPGAVVVAGHAVWGWRRMTIAMQADQQISVGLVGESNPFGLVRIAVVQVCEVGVDADGGQPSLELTGQIGNDVSFDQTATLQPVSSAPWPGSMTTVLPASDGPAPRSFSDSRSS